MAQVKPFKCDECFDPCCQFVDRDWYDFVGNTTVRQGVAMAVQMGQALEWFKKYQVSDYEPRRVGDWEIYKFTVDPLDAAVHNALEYDPGRYIAPADYTSLIWHGHGNDERFPAGQTIMSDTPSEIQDHIEFIDRAYGRVLINGLGIGMVAHSLLREEKRDCIEHIDIVEYNQEVIDLVGYYFRNDPKVTIHHADAFTAEWPEDAYWHCAWHDIWYEVNASDISEHRKLMARYRSRVEYQDCWMRRWYLGYLRWERQRDQAA